MTTKRLRARGLTTADIAAQRYTEYFELVDDGVEYADLFHPAFYEHHKKLRPHDIIRLVHPAGDFDVFVTVQGVIAGGIVVNFLGGRPPKGIDPYAVAEEERAAALRVTVVPIMADGRPAVYIQHLAKTKWRVIGLNNTEVKRDIATKEEAEVEMAIYLNAIRMRLPTAEEILAELQLREKMLEAKEAEAIKAATKPAA